MEGRRLNLSKNRFDIIYLMLDIPDERRDALLARHLVGLYQNDEDRQRLVSHETIIDRRTLSAYLTYARLTVHPELVQDSMEVLAEEYVRWRQAGVSSKTVSATTRQLEAMIRLSEAHAKMR